MFYLSSMLRDRDRRLLPASAIPSARIKTAALAFAACAGLLTACGEWKQDPGALTARSAAAQPGPDCSACHAYVLNDSNHLFHLFKADSNKSINGAVTCLDCHAAAMAWRESPLADSIFIDPSGGFWSALQYPLSATIRAYRLDHIDTLRQHRPIPAPAVPGRLPLYREYLTSLAHMNGRVDVDFDARITDTAKFSGASPRYNPAEATCSAMACHERVNPYRWAVPSKGWPGLKGE